MELDYVSKSLTSQIGITVVLLCLIAICVTCFPRIYSHWKFLKIIHKIPGPTLHPLWGSFDRYGPKEEGIKKMDNYVLENPDKKILLLRIGPFTNFIFFQYPEEIGELLCKKPTELPKDDYIYGFVKPFLGEGLLISNFDKWQTRRRMLTPGFHYDILKHYVYVYNNVVEVFLRKCKCKIDKGHDVIPIFENVTLLTLDVMLQCVCSFESGCQIEDRDDEYVAAVKSNTNLIFKQATFLPYAIKPIFYLSPHGAAWRKNCKIAKERSLQVVESRRRFLIECPKVLEDKPFKDFIDILLTSKDSSGKELTDEGIVEEMTTFIFRGHDTTASAISWTLHLLGLYPKYQTMCREEVRSVLKNRESDRIIYEDLSKLSFLSMCIKESMRIYMPVNDIFRRPTEDIHINGYLIPKGTSLIISLGALHRNPHVWKNPFEFNPLRFDCELPGGHPFAFIPFSAGHRNCIGQKFAMNEQLVALSRILNTFEVESLSREVRRIAVVVTKPEEDLKIRFKVLK